MSADIKPLADIAPAPEQRSPRRGDARRTVGAFYPLLVLLVSSLAWAAFQAYQFRLEADALQGARAGLLLRLQAQQPAQRQLESLAVGVRGLAEKGNPGAARIVEELRRRGVTINAAAAATE